MGRPIRPIVTTTTEPGTVRPPEHPLPALTTFELPDYAATWKMPSTQRRPRTRPRACCKTSSPR
jgi:hypothetical protein